MMVRVNYRELAANIAALCDGEDDVITLMATLACEVHHADDRFHWTGFYRVVAPELLKIGPYQGAWLFNHSVCTWCLWRSRTDGRNPIGG